MNKLIALSSFVILNLMSSFSEARSMRYVALPEQSKWEVLVNNPLECRLVHPIPHYGQAEFSSHASKKMNLDLKLKMFRPMGKTSSVSLISMPPPWNPGESADRVSTMKFFQQFDGYVGGENAWRILSELEKGRYPTFSYADWLNRNQRVEVSLSSVTFRQEYDVFISCLNQLLPYSFEDISFTILHYDGNSVQLNKASQQRLSQIAEYIKYNTDIDLVLISTYTASNGDKETSQLLSEKRAAELKNFFNSIGLQNDRIKVQGYGERRPIADNLSLVNENKNRRVVISLGRTQI